MMLVPLLTLPRGAEGVARTFKMPSDDATQKRIDDAGVADGSTLAAAGAGVWS